MTIWQASLIALWASFIQARTWGGGLTLTMRFSPLATSLFCGIILGDITTAVVTGGTIQLITMGQVAPGGQMPSEPTIAAAIAVPATIIGGFEPQAAVAIAIPIGLLGGYLYQVKIFLNTFAFRYIEKVVAALDERKFIFAIIILPTILCILLHFPILFVALYFGTDIVANWVSSLEGSVAFHVLEVVGGGLGALGIALLLRLIGRKELLWFFFLAYFSRYMLVSLDISAVTWAVMGIIIAGIYTLVTTQNKQTIA